MNTTANLYPLINPLLFTVHMRITFGTGASKTKYESFLNIDGARKRNFSLTNLYMTIFK